MTAVKNLPEFDLAASAVVLGREQNKIELLYQNFELYSSRATQSNRTKHNIT